MEAKYNKNLRKLWRKVLITGLRDLTVRNPKGLQKTYKRKALNWVLNTPINGVRTYDFDFVCALAGLNAEYLKARVLEIIVKDTVL